MQDQFGHAVPQVKVPILTFHGALRLREKEIINSAHRATLTCVAHGESERTRVAFTLSHF